MKTTRLTDLNAHHLEMLQRALNAQVNQLKRFENECSPKHHDFEMIQLDLRTTEALLGRVILAQDVLKLPLYFDCAGGFNPQRKG